jgi:hypothetical protein
MKTRYGSGATMTVRSARGDAVEQDQAEITARCKVFSRWAKDAADVTASGCVARPGSAGARRASSRARPDVWVQRGGRAARLVLRRSPLKIGCYDDVNACYQ